MFKKDKKIENKAKKEDKNLNKNVKQKTNFKKYLINIFVIVVMIAILSGLALLTFFKEKETSSIFEDNIDNIEKQEEVLEENLNTDKEFYTKTIQKLTENITILEKQIDFNNEYIKNLQSKVVELESRLNNISIEPQRTELIKLAVNTQLKILNELSYSQELSSLKSLAGGNKELLEKIDILELYKNTYPTKKEIKQSFDKEFENFSKEHNILNNNGSNISKFLSNFVVIKKVKNVENNTADSFMLKLKNAMETENYKLSLQILENNSEYAKSFSKTMENVKINVSINNAIEEIINYLINN